MKSSSYFKGVALLSLALLAFLYSNCNSNFQNLTKNSSTTIGNPITTLVVAPYTSSVIANGINVCLRQIKLKASNSTEIQLNFDTPRDLNLPFQGIQLGSLPIPEGNYTQASLVLSDSCGGGRSIGLQNTNGTIKSTESLSMDFTGQVTIAGSARKMTFQIQPIANNLANAASDQEIPSRLAASTGTVQASFTLKRVFVTSTTYSGNLGGISGADALCGTRANLAGMPGAWKAWISDSNVNARDRISDVSPWYLVDGTTMAFPTQSSLSTGPIVPVQLTEMRGIYNGLVWTGTASNGTQQGPSYCSNWTDASGSTVGRVGDASTTYNWTDDGTNMNCNSQQKPIYCFEQ